MVLWAPPGVLSSPGSSPRDRQSHYSTIFYCLLSVIGFFRPLKCFATLFYIVTTIFTSISIISSYLLSFHPISVSTQEIPFDHAWAKRKISGVSGICVRISVIGRFQKFKNLVGEHVKTMLMNQVTSQRLQQKISAASQTLTEDMLYNADAPKRSWLFLALASGSFILYKVPIPHFKSEHLFLPII